MMRSNAETQQSVSQQSGEQAMRMIRYYLRKGQSNAHELAVSLLSLAIESQEKGDMDKMSLLDRAAKEAHKAYRSLDEIRIKIDLILTDESGDEY